MRRRKPFRLGVQLCLDGDSAAQRLNRAGELQKKTIAHGFE
jgi:hypothetical protein